MFILWEYLFKYINKPIIVSPEIQGGRIYWALKLPEPKVFITTLSYWLKNLGAFAQF